MDNYKQNLEDFFNPEILKQNLIIASLFIAVFDNFKASLIDKVKYFYFSGIQNGVEQFEDYERDVLNKIKSKNNKQIKATLRWLKENKFLTETEETQFTKFTDKRNQLAHEMKSMLLEGFSEEIYELYADMIKLFTKIEQKWIIDIEMTINPPDIPEEDILWEGITSINLEFIRIMTEIAFTGNDKYMHMVKNYVPNN